MREKAGTGPAELALAALAAALGAAAASVWLWTGTAGALFGAGWPRVSLSVLIDAAQRLPAHAGDPRMAFPPPLRAQLPGPAGFYAALALLALLGAAIVVAALGLNGRLAPAGGARRGFRHGAQWARGGELRALRGVVGRRRASVRAARLALGYQGAWLLRAEERHALVVFGPPQSGKSAAIAIPNLLEWESTAIASSIKSDLLDATIARRRQLGEVMVFDPLQLLGTRGSTWSPLHSSHTWDRALSSALRLASAGEVESRDVKGGSFWSAAAEQRLAPLLFAAARTGRDMGAVVRWAYGQGDAELPGILHALLEDAEAPSERADAQAAFDAHAGFAAMAGDTRSSVESTVQLLLRAYRSPAVRESARSCEITGERLLGGPNTLYLIGDPHRSRLLRPIFLALLQELVDGAYAKAGGSPGKRLPQPLLVCLDELGNTAPLQNLGEIASSAPSHNIQLISIFHDIAQARTRYGEQAQTVINSHRARMLLPGVADLETLRYFSGLIGEEEVRDRGEAAQRRSPPRRRPLAAPEQLRQIGHERAVLIYGRLAPTVLRLRLYFKDRGLRRLAAPAEQGSSGGTP